MSFSDILSVLQWWFILFLIGIIFLPFTKIIFNSFFDKGYIFSKMLGLGLLSYVIFLLGIIHVLPFSTLTSYLVLLACFIVMEVRWLTKKNRLLIKKDIINYISVNFSAVFWEEAIFFVCLFIWSYVRGFNSDIHGLEKYMDFGFINSILRSSYFPPNDIWFTPNSINYYYFGHLMTAVLTKLSNLPSNITFNLMVATVFGLSFTAAFSIGANLVFLFRNKVYNHTVTICGLLAAFLTTLGGNLHIIYSFFGAYSNESPVPPWQLKFQPLLFPNNYWYPNATRFIYHTIHEFPIYSWVVSDLHGHVLDIPFVLTTIAVLFVVISKSRSTDLAQTQKKHVLKNFTSELIYLFKTPIIDMKYIGIISFLLAVMYMTNAWDGAIYFLLTLFVLSYFFYQSRTSFKIFNFLNHWVFGLIAYSFLCLVLYILITLPYSIFFKPFVSGIGVLCAPNFLIKIGKIGPFLFEASHCDLSPWWQLLILYGFFIFFIISFIILLTRSTDQQHYSLQGKTIKLKKLESNSQTTSFIRTTDIFVLCLILLSIFLIILPELIYVKDIYPTYYRANTMFKLVFQAFIMLSLSSAYILFRYAMWFKMRWQRKQFSFVLAAWMIIALTLCGLVALYPYLAIFSYYGNLRSYHGLDGTTYLQTQYPTDYAAIQWINKNIIGQPVILEAQGDSYTDYARISSNTGLPTVLGWTVHEWLWRGSYAIPARRINEVQTMYTSTDILATKTLLNKYHVEYVFIGVLEKQKYSNLDTVKFDQLGKVVYQNGNTKIYKLFNNS